MSHLESWAQHRLASLMQLPEEDTKQMVTYVMSLSKSEASSYLIGFLGDSGEPFDFITQFLDRRFPPSAGIEKDTQKARRQASNPKTNSPKQWKDERNVYRKNNDEDVYFVGYITTVYVKRFKKKTVAPAPKVEPDRVDDAELKDAVDKEMKRALKKERQAAKKAAASVSADFIDGGVKVGNVVGRDGRTFCECLEGPGPCPSCGSPVESALQQINLIQSTRRKAKVREAITDLTSSKSKNVDAYKGSRYGQKAGAQPPSAAVAIGTPGVVSEGSYPVLLSERDREALGKAVEQKERLLEYQRNSAVRTRVHDVASDFDAAANDSTNIWLTPEERAEALKKSQDQRRKDDEQRRRRVITIDLGSKKVIAVDPKQYEPPPSSAPFIPDFTPSTTTTQTASINSLTPLDPGSTGVFRNPYLGSEAPRYVPVDLSKIEKEGGVVTLKMRRAAAAADAAGREAEEEERRRRKEEGEGDGLSSKGRRAARREGKGSRPHPKVERVQDLFRFEEVEAVV
ncbi:hypothetical protein HDU67_006551 [Dinochytrium kinnereticum]|nr:hypothetical protein HDU67_006551 [Dinochytrium kinnereticum]